MQLVEHLYLGDKCLAVGSVICAADILLLVLADAREPLLVVAAGIDADAIDVEMHVAFYQRKQGAVLIYFIYVNGIPLVAAEHMSKAGLIEFMVCGGRNDILVVQPSVVSEAPYFFSLVVYNQWDDAAVGTFFHKVKLHPPSLPNVPDAKDKPKVAVVVVVLCGADTDILRHDTLPNGLQAKDVMGYNGIHQGQYFALV